MKEQFISSLESLPEKSRVVLYGAGNIGLYFLQEAKRERTDIEILCLIDDFKFGKRIHEKEVISLEEIEKCGEIDLILVTSTYWKEIVQKLKEKKLSNFLIADPLLEEKPPMISKEIKGIKLHSFVPTKTLEVITRNFEIIEPDTLKWIDSMGQDETFMDVGSSNGLFSVYAAIFSKVNVISIEPDAQNYAVLEMNHYLNKEKISNPIISLNVALSDKCSLLKLISISYGAGQHNKVLEGMMRSQEFANHSDHEQYVMSFPMDDLMSQFQLPEPNHIKIDVDGAELSVLKGASKTIANRGLKSILIECSSVSGEFEKVSQELIKHGFELEDTFEINEITGIKVIDVRNYLFRKN